MNSHKNVVLIIVALMVGVLSFVAGYMISPHKAHSHKHCAHSHKNEVAESRDIHDSKDHVGDVLLSMNGETVISTVDFEKYVDSLIAINPQISSLISVVPGMKENIFNGLKSIKIIERWASETELEKNVQFKKELEQIHTFMRAELLRKYFQQMLSESLAPTEQEIRTYYEEHKVEIPELVIQEGGFKSSALLCDSKEQQEALLKELEADPLQFEKKATDNKLSVIDFGIITAQSTDIDPLIKSKIMATNAVPAIYGIEKEGSAYFIVFVESAIEALFRPIEEVKDSIAQLVVNQKLQAAFISKIEALAEEYKVKEYKELLQNSATAVDDNAMSVEDALALFDDAALEDSEVSV